MISFLICYRCDCLGSGAESASTVQLSSSLRSGLQSRYIPVLWVPAINSVWLVSSGLVQHNFEWMFRLNILRCDKRENRLWGLSYCFQLWLRKRKCGIGCTAASECAHALYRLWNPAFCCALAKLLLQSCLEKFFCLLKCVRRLQRNHITANICPSPFSRPSRHLPIKSVKRTL